MTRETKVSLLVGIGVILLIGIIISDTVSVHQQDAAQLTGFADQSQQGIRGHGQNAPTGEGQPNPLPTPAQVNGGEQARADGGRESESASPTRPPVAAHIGRGQVRDDGSFNAAEPAHQPQQVNTLTLSHEGVLFSPSNDSERSHAGRDRDEQQTAASSSNDQAAEREPEPTSEPEPAHVHEVSSGETLYDIARHYYGSGNDWRLIAQHNEDIVGEEGAIREGQEIRIPYHEQLAASEAFEDAGTQRRVRIDAVAPAGREAQEPRTVTVGSGDTLSRIAERHLGSRNRWRELYEANRDELDSPDRLVVGQTLQLPE